MIKDPNHQSVESRSGTNTTHGVAAGLVVVIDDGAVEVDVPGVGRIIRLRRRRPVPAIKALPLERRVPVAAGHARSTDQFLAAFQWFAGKTRL
jgi:hypothetical protein